MSNNKQPLIVASGPFLYALRNEVAQELGLHDYEFRDKGMISSRVNGLIGGTITKRLIALAEQEMSRMNHPSR